MTTTVVVVAVATTTAAVMSAAAVAMVRMEARAMLTAVISVAASSGSKGSNNTTMDGCNAILLWYADVFDVRRDNNGNRASTFNRSNIGRGVANFGIGIRCTLMGQQHWLGAGSNTGGSSGSSGRKRRRGGTS